MKDNTLKFTDFAEKDYGVAIPSVDLSRSSKEKSFREIFCVNEIPESEYPKIALGSDPLMLIPGKEVVGKGLDNRIEECYVVIKKKKDIFVYQTGSLVEDEKANLLNEDCILIFLRNTAEAYVLVKGDGGSGKKLFCLGDDVEIYIYLETDLLNGRNGYYACLARDIPYDINIWSVTADARTAEVYKRLFVFMSGV